MRNRRHWEFERYATTDDLAQQVASDLDLPLQQVLDMLDLMWLTSLGTQANQHHALHRLLEQRKLNPYARIFAPYTPGQCCEACYVAQARTPAAVVVNALWASGSWDGAHMPLCWAHFWRWQQRLQPVMASVLQPTAFSPAGKFVQVLP